MVSSERVTITVQNRIFIFKASLLLKRKVFGKFEIEENPLSNSNMIYSLPVLKATSVLGPTIVYMKDSMILGYKIFSSYPENLQLKGILS